MGGGGAAEEMGVAGEHRSPIVVFMVIRPKGCTTSSRLGMTSFVIIIGRVLTGKYVY